MDPGFKHHNAIKFGLALATIILIVAISIILAIKSTSPPRPPAASVPPPTAGSGNPASSNTGTHSGTGGDELPSRPQHPGAGNAGSELLPGRPQHPGVGNAGGELLPGRPQHPGVGGAGNPAGAGNPGNPGIPDAGGPHAAVLAPAAPAPAAGPGPPATERQEFLDRQLSFLRAGHLVYRPPSPIRVSDWRRVVVRVSGPSAPPDFVAGLPGSGPVRDRHVSVGSDLIADLTGPDFKIVRVGNDDGRRTLETGTFAEWQWDVQPLYSGQRMSSLVLYVRLQDGGPPLDIKTFVEKVEVQVNPVYIALQWAKDYGPATGLTVPVIVAAVWAVIRRGRQSVAPATASIKPAGSAPSRGKRARKKRSTRARSSSGDAHAKASISLVVIVCSKPLPWSA